MTAPGRLVTGEPVNYAAGLYVGSYRGVATVRHPGRNNVDFIRFPDSGRAVAVMCNRVDVDAELLAEQVADVFLAGTLRPPGAELSAGRAGPLVPGDYVAPSGERMRIVEQGGKLALDGWGTLRAAGNGQYAAGPATDGLRVAPGGAAGHERLTIAFQSGLPIVFERYTAVAPAPDALRALTGTYHNDALRSVYAVTLDGGALALSGPDRAVIPLEPMTPDLFAAGIWRVHVRRAPGGAVAAIDIGTARTPPIVYERVAAPR